MANKGISTGHIPLGELPDALTGLLTDLTPRDTGEMAQSWQIKTKYKDRRYVGNTRVASGDVRRKTKDGSKGEARSGVPLSNVLEYSDNPHNGFIRRCFDEAEPQIFEAIKNTIKNGGK